MSFDGNNHAAASALAAASTTAHNPSGGRMEKEVITISGESDTAPSFDEEVGATKRREPDDTTFGNKSNTFTNEKDRASTAAVSGSQVLHSGTSVMNNASKPSALGGNHGEKEVSRKNLLEAASSDFRGITHPRRVSNEGERVDNQGLEVNNDRVSNDRKGETVARKVSNLGGDTASRTTFSWEQANPFESYQQEQASRSQASSSRTNYTANGDDDQESLAGMNGTDYNGNPDIGSFGFEEDSSDDDDIDSSDDEYQRRHQRSRASLLKTTTRDDDVVMEEGAPAKKAESSKPTSQENEPEVAVLASPPPSERETPKSISPFDDTDDDSDISVSAHVVSRKKKTSKKRKKQASKTVAAKLPVHKSPDRKAAIQRAVAEHSPSIQGSRERPRQHSRGSQGMLRSFKTTGGSAPEKATTPSPTGLKEGDRVYAKWTNKKWYWGMIVAVKRKKYSSYDHYSILFDDGYSLDVSRKSICTVDEARRKKGQHPPPLPSSGTAFLPAPMEPTTVATTVAPPPVVETIGEGNRLTPQELYANRCGECELCIKPECGSCACCRRNKKRSSSDKDMEVCLQKMCLCIPNEQKKQRAQGLPPKWTFIFTADWLYKGRRTYVPGLVLFTPENGSFRSVDAAVSNSAKLRARNANVIQDFNQGAGITPSHYKDAQFWKGRCEARNAPMATVSVQSNQSASNESPAASTPSKAQLRNKSLITERLEACEKCANCTKDACGKCFVCTSSPDGVSPQCFQKMCYMLPAEAKAVDAPGFPKGWTFHFAEEPARPGPLSYEPIPYLYILSGGGKKFRSVEAAVGSTKRLGDRVELARTFYSYVGLPEFVPDNQGVASKVASLPSQSYEASRNGHDPSQHSETGRKQETISNEASLSKYRTVGTRVYCKVGDQGHWGVITSKTEVGLNEYEFMVRCERDNSVLDGLDAQSVLSEFHYKKYTGMDPPPAPLSAEYESDEDDEPEERPYKKQKTISSSEVTTTLTTKDHFLVGKRFRSTWTDVHSRSKVVYGTVTECEKKNEEVQNFKIVYDETSRELVNSIENGCSLSVPASQMVPASFALGGCIRYEQQFQSANHSTCTLVQEIGRRMHSCNWVTPMLRNEELRYSSDERTRLPRLTLVVHEFKLELSVKQSSIPNAGFGVFLKCTPMFEGNDAPFVLRAGELVDLGVYAPFRIEDKRPEAVFFAKNFIHKYEPEAWAFGAGDSRHQFDVTDDVTGTIHSEAKKHIQAYVNESDHMEEICVRAEYDAEFSVHYLLGHDDATKGPFSVPTDGTEREIFINYGTEYEKIRVRKGYGFHPEQQRHLLKALKYEDVANVIEMNEFSASDVEACVGFLLNLFAKEDEFSTVVVHRALIVAAVFQRRAQELFLEQWSGDTVEMDEEEGTDVNLKKLQKLSESLVLLLLDMATDDVRVVKEIQAAGNVDGVLLHVLKTNFSDRELSKLSDLISY